MLKEKKMKLFDNLFQNEKPRILPVVERAFSFLFLSVVVVLFSVQPGKAAMNQSDGGWQFMAEAYFWYANMDGKSATGGDIQIDDNDLVDALDFGFMTTLGAKKDKWGFLVDVIYLDVSDNTNKLIDGVGVNLNVELAGWIVTPMVGYEVFREGDTNVNIIGGARYLNLSTDIDFRNADPTSAGFRGSVSDSGSNWDAIIGVKGDLFVTDRFFIPYYADIGAGNSQFTWQLMGGLGYRFDLCDVLVAYRYMDWNFDDNDVFDDLNVNGFAAGVRFYF